VGGFPAIAIKRLNAVSVGVAQTTVAHGLSAGITNFALPKVWAVIVGPNAAAAYVSQTIAPDATNIYLIANAAATLCDVLVGPADI
jgi:hypothetical protein